MVSKASSVPQKHQTKWINIYQTQLQKVCHVWPVPWCCIVRAHVFLGLAISKPCDTDSEMKRVEKKLANLKSSIVEKCQSSKMWLRLLFILPHIILHLSQLDNWCWINVFDLMFDVFSLNFMIFADLELWTIITDIEDCSPYFPIGIGSPSPYISQSKTNIKYDAMFTMLKLFLVCNTNGGMLLDHMSLSKGTILKI